MRVAVSKPMKAGWNLKRPAWRLVLRARLLTYLLVLGALYTSAANGAPAADLSVQIELDEALKQQGDLRSPDAVFVVRNGGSRRLCLLKGDLPDRGYVYPQVSGFGISAHVAGEGSARSLIEPRKPGEEAVGVVHLRSQETRTFRFDVYEQFPGAHGLEVVLRLRLRYAPCSKKTRTVAELGVLGSVEAQARLD